jgi:hypothetical protein
LSDVTVLNYTTAGGTRSIVPARDVGDGEYEAEVNVTQPGTYYIFVAAASQKAKHNDLPYFTLVGLDEETAKAFAARDAAAKAAAEKRKQAPVAPAGDGSAR